MAWSEFTQGCEKPGNAMNQLVPGLTTTHTFPSQHHLGLWTGSPWLCDQADLSSHSISAYFWWSTGNQCHCRAEIKLVQISFSCTEWYGSFFPKTRTVRSAKGLQESVWPPPTSTPLYVSACYNRNGIVTLFVPLWVPWRAKWPVAYGGDLCIQKWCKGCQSQNCAPAFCSEWGSFVIHCGVCRTSLMCSKRISPENSSRMEGKTKVSEYKSL